jgi:hypothetical protein
LLEADAPHHFRKAWVGAQILEPRIHLQPHHARGPIVEAFVQPLEGLIFLSEAGIQQGQAVLFCSLSAAA